MKTITVKCGICQKTLLVAQGTELTNDDANVYQQSTSCDADMQANIVSVLTEE